VNRNRAEWRVPQVYLAVVCAGAAVGVAVGVALGSGPVAAFRWAYYGGVTGAALVGFPVVFAGMSGLLARPGSRALVLTLYGVVVGIAGFTGLVIGSLGITDLRPPAYLGVVEFPPTPIGLSLYGALTLATILGALLGLVEFVSRRYVEERPAERE
jgi:hypothetical protein